MGDHLTDKLLPPPLSLGSYHPDPDVSSAWHFKTAPLQLYLVAQTITKSESSVLAGISIVAYLLICCRQVLDLYAQCTSALSYLSIYIQIPTTCQIAN
jgi:hypothetical protein